MGDQNMYLVFTICSNNYLAQAVTLGNSLILYNPNYKFVIGLVDTKHSEIDYSKIGYEVLEVEKIRIPDFESLTMKYTVIELNTAVKPFYFKFFFEWFPEYETVIYLDPDIRVFSGFTELEKELVKSDIVITPHFCTPLNDDKLQTEEDFLNSGLYNLGFIAVKKTSEGLEMINWWAERLLYKAYIDLRRGLFTDQIWINFVPLFFSNVKILTHPGYNMAYWNLHERSISIKTYEYYVNDQYPLVFYHFSGFNPLMPEVLSKYQNRFSLQDLPEIRDLFIDYSLKLFQNGYKTYIEYPNVFSNLKSKADIEKRKTEIQKIPFLLRMFRIIILKISSRYNLLLD